MLTYNIITDHDSKIEQTLLLGLYDISVDPLFNWHLLLQEE